MSFNNPRRFSIPPSQPAPYQFPPEAHFPHPVHHPAHHHPHMMHHAMQHAMQHPHHLHHHHPALPQHPVVAPHPATAPHPVPVPHPQPHATPHAQTPMTNAQIRLILDNIAQNQAAFEHTRQSHNPANFTDFVHTPDTRNQDTLHPGFAPQSSHKRRRLSDEPPNGAQFANCSNNPNHNGHTYNAKKPSDFARPLPKIPASHPPPSSDPLPNHASQPNTNPTQFAPADDAEDDITGTEEDDWQDRSSICKLYEMSQQHRIICNLNFSKETEKMTEKHGKLWYVEATCTRVPRNKDDPVISITGFGRKKAQARQRAARRLLETIVKETALTEKIQLPTSPKPNNPDSARAKASGLPSEKFSATQANAALNVLHQDKHLLSIPTCTSEEVKEGWMITMTVHTAQHGEMDFVGIATQKKTAKSMAADKAFEELKRLNIPTIEYFRNVKPFKHPETRKEQPGAAPSAPFSASASRDAVRLSDDESERHVDIDLMSEDEDEDGIFLLPENYELTLASKEDECEQWLEKNVEINDDVGVFIDSRSARQSFDEEDGSKMKTSGYRHPAICVSTKTHGLVLQHLHASSRSLEDGDDEVWVPESIAEFFECDVVRKHGHTIDEGLEFLRDSHNVEFCSIGDVTSTSIALSGVSKTSGGLFKTSLTALSEQWLRKELPPLEANRIWSRGHKMAGKLVGEGSDEAAAGLLSAYISLILREAWQPDVRRKMVQTYGSGTQVKDLVEKILKRPHVTN